MRRLVIFNVAASRAAAGGEVVRRLAAERIGDVRETGGPGDAARLAREAAREGVERILVAGGDGTVNAAVNGLMVNGLMKSGHGNLVGRGEAGPVLEVLPLGTGNDFARTLGMPMDLEEAVELLYRGGAQPPVRRVDVVRVRVRAGDTARHGTGTARHGTRHAAEKPDTSYFVNVAVGGVGGVVGARVTRRMKRRWGSLAYRLQAVRSLPSLTAHEVSVRMPDDGSEEELDQSRSYGVIVANGRFAGGGIPVAPDARPDDGLLDVIVLPAPGIVRTAGLLLAALRGRHIDRPGVRVRRARRVELRSTPPMPFDADGEQLRGEAMLMEIVPRAASVVVSPDVDW